MEESSAACGARGDRSDVSGPSGAYYLGGGEHDGVHYLRSLVMHVLGSDLDYFPADRLRGVDGGGAASFLTVILGAFAAGWFHIRGFLAGWDRIDAADSNGGQTIVPQPNAATGLLVWSALLTVLTLCNLWGIMQNPSTLERASALQAQSQTCDSTCQAMSGNSSDSQ